MDGRDVLAKDQFAPREDGGISLVYGFSVLCFPLPSILVCLPFL